MSDILKEAIADAKAVRETALQNAKAALEEAFAPHLKNMLSAKLSEEDMEEGMHDDEKEEGDYSEDMEEGMHDDEEEEGMHKEGEGMHDDEAEEGNYDEGMHDEEEEEGVYEEDDIEGDDDEDEELDLEAIIKELEAEVNEAEDEDEEGEEIEENDVSSDIGNGENKQPGKANQSSGIGKAKNESVDESDVNEEEEIKEEEEEEVAEVAESNDELDGIKAELDEYKEAVEFLQDKLHEVNILNAKLLFTNKLFKEYALDKDQKMKVVETMDRAQSTREIKLVYSTLAEAFSQAGKISRKQTVKESASKPVSSTAPKKIISEETEVANRFKKLAGII